MTEEEEIFEEAEEAVEEEIEVPAPPPLKRARAKKEPAPPKAPKEDLKQRVECDDCGRQVSLHTLKYGKHRCPGKKEPKEAKPAMTEKEATKPLKKKAVIQQCDTEDWGYFSSLLCNGSVQCVHAPTELERRGGAS